jgi:hypothetical protein
VIAVWVEGDGRIAARRAGSDRTWQPLEWLSRDGARGADMPLAAMGPRDRAMVAWTEDARVVFARVE